MAKIGMDTTIDTSELSALDRVAQPVHRAFKAMFDAMPPVRDALTGEWLGHPIHPVLNDIPVGAFTAGLTLDLIEVLGETKKLRRGADAVQTLGLASALVAALAGFADFSRLEGQKAVRVAFVHGAANLVITGIVSGSLLARGAGLRKLGIALSGAGYGLMLVSGMLGAAVAYKLGGVAQAQATTEAEGEAEVDTTATPKRRRAPQRAVSNGSVAR
jgi:uncharacterized membrane protein